MSKISDLTPSEQGVLRLLAEGFTVKEIALRHNISVKTVDTHRARIAKKSGGGTIVNILRQYYEFVERT